jgi:PAS domain S-box-containing protein
MLSTGHPMFIWWGPQLIQFYNDAYRRSIGPERHPSALGQQGRECWAEIWDIIGPQIGHVMAGDGYTWNENQLVPITRSGKREDVYWTYSYGPIDDETAPNGIGGVLVVCTETTEQVLTEQHLKLAEARWRSLFQQAPGFMCIVGGAEHVYEFANERYLELIGKRNIIGMRVKDAVPEAEGQVFVNLLDEVYRSGKSYVGSAMPITFNRDSGQPEKRFVDFIYEPIKDTNGKIIGVLADGYDVTDRVRADDSLRREDRRKDEFLAMLAHELRNPLAPIRYASDLLQGMPELDSDTRRLGDIISRQTDQMSRLVDDLLDVSRVATGRIELQKSAIDLNQTIALAIESIQPLAKVKQQQIELSSEPRLFVCADQARLVQCIANILSNASKYSNDNSVIDVKLGREGEQAVIRVTDEGVGIAAEVLPTVFDMFSQASRTLDRSQGGLGIGLAVVARLIEMHDGQVCAQSNGLGEGSMFVISLPLIAPPSEALAQSRSSAESAARRILVVDDNLDSANALAQLLKLVGHEARAVFTPEDALEMAVTFEADVILLDIGLPRMDGYAVARQLRTSGFTGMLIAITGYSQTNDVQAAEDSGFDAHLAKPANMSELQDLIQHSDG